VTGALALALRSMKWTSIAARGAAPLGGVAVVALVAAYGVGHRAPLAASPATAVAAGVAAGSLGASSPPDALARAPASVADVPLAAEREPAPIEGQAAPASVRSPAAPPAAPRAASARRVEPASASPVDRLREEAARLDRARALLQAGDANGALGAVDDYDARFAAAPSLAEESTLLRIEALAKKGDRGGAASLARRFLGKYPASVHAERVAALLRRLSP